MLTEKWADILDLEGAPAITDSHRRAVTAQLIENQVKAMKEDAAHGQFFTMLQEDGVPANNGGEGIALGQQGKNTQMAGYDPVLINLVRRAMPQLIAFDVCGVQPMTMPTGLIFALRSRYTSQNGAEALYDEADTGFGGDGFGELKNTHSATNWADAPDDFKVGHAMTTSDAEHLGTADKKWGEMAMSIERTSVVAQTRALKAEYTMELAQDLKSVHGLDAENELSNILATEILSEINREIIRDIYVTAEWGCATGTMEKGVFDLDVDADGRWSAEKYKGLLMRIEREANRIAQRTRRGRGNFIICSSDVASALQMAGMLDYAPAIQNNLNVNEAQTTFAGILNGKFKVFVDPYQSNGSSNQFVVVGYKGSSAYDAGMFYCPYVPLQLVRAQDPNTFQPKIGFKTRYGIAFNPMVSAMNKGKNTAGELKNSNYYYRKFLVKNL